MYVPLRQHPHAAGHGHRRHHSFAGVAQANDNTVIVSKQVSTAGLDLGKLADAQTLYMRLRRAADDVCTHALRVSIWCQFDDPRGCFEKALGNAVRQVNAPLVTQAYLLTHTLRDASNWGIELPAERAEPIAGGTEAPPAAANGLNAPGPERSPQKVALQAGSGQPALRLEIVCGRHSEPPLQRCMQKTQRYGAEVPVGLSQLAQR